MKNIKRLMLGAVIFFTALLTVVPVYAQDDNVQEGSTSGKPVIELGKIESTEGHFTVEDPNGILASYTTELTNIGGTVDTGNGRTYLYTDGDAENATITVNVTLNSGAPVGACAVFKYTSEGITKHGKDYSDLPDDQISVSAKICVVEKPVNPTPTPTPTPTPSKPGTGVKVNYSALFAQVEIAEELAVTENSFVLDVALSFAKNLMANKHQFVVDFAANVLEAVINGVK